MRTPKTIRELKRSIQRLRDAITEDINNEQVAREDRLLIASISSVPSQFGIALAGWQNEIRNIETLDLHRYTKDGKVINVEIFETSIEGPLSEGLSLWVARDADAPTHRVHIVKSHTRAGIEGGLNKLGYVYTI